MQLPWKIRRTAWIGPTDGCFDWMRGKLCGNGVREVVQLPTIDLLQSRSDFDRIIVACRNRIDYPWRTIQSLQENSAVAPWALAVDGWWEGARRTGLGVTGHVTLPWYRWWDGWYAWFHPRSPADQSTASRLYSPVHVPQDLVLSDSVERANRSRCRFIVVASCEPTAAAWLCQASLIGINGLHLQPHELAGWLIRTDDVLGTEIDHVLLLDDSIAGTLNCQDVATNIAQLVQECCRKLPRCRVIVGASFPRFDDWLLWQKYGAAEIIAKPSFGLPLARLLSCEAHAAANQDRLFSSAALDRM